MSRLLFAIPVGLVLAVGGTVVADQARTPAAAPATAKPPVAKPATAPASPTRPAVSHATPSTADADTQLVKQYCATCHSDRGKAGQLTLASFNAAEAADHADVVEKMIRKLRTGMMPPAGAKRPDEKILTAFATSL